METAYFKRKIEKIKNTKDRVDAAYFYNVYSLEFIQTLSSIKWPQMAWEKDAVKYGQLKESQIKSNTPFFRETFIDMYVRNLENTNNHVIENIYADLKHGKDISEDIEWYKMARKEVKKAITNLIGAITEYKKFNN